MKKPRRERSPLYPRIGFGFTAHPITVWAGVILLRLYFEWIKLREELNETLVNFSKRSNNQITSVEVMLSWFYGLALGAERFEHFSRYRRDRLLAELLGIKRYGSPDTLRRLFLRFRYREVTEVSERLMRFSLARMRPILMGHTLDLDSTVFCRYGEQEGSLKGYNPNKPGRRSHHPLVAFLAEGRRLLWASMRSGNSGSANGCVEFIKQAVTVVPPGHRIGLVRADAGFFEKRFLEYLESEELPYIIVARLTPIVRKLVIHRVPSAAWRVVGRGIEVADLEVSLPNWKTVKRRFVCLRQQIAERPEARGRRLIDCPGYAYRVMVTRVPYAAEVVTRMYAGRADSENRIKELKEDLSLDTFVLNLLMPPMPRFAWAVCSTIYWRTFVRRCCRARGLKNGFGRSETLSFWWVRISSLRGAECKSVLRCLNPTDPSSCVACAPCRKDFRLRRSWNGVLPTKPQAIPLKSLPQYRSYRLIQPSITPLEISIAESGFSSFRLTG
jgi:hypothetical protein